MKINTKLEILKRKIKEVEIDGWRTTAKELNTNNSKFLNALEEIEFLMLQMEEMASEKPIQVNRNVMQFDIFISRYLYLFGKCLNMTAKKFKFDKVEDIPDNVFRAMSCDKISKEMPFGSGTITVVPFRSDSMDNQIVYSMDEYKSLKQLDLSSEQEDNIRSTKELFEGCRIISEFDEMWDEIKSKGAGRARKSVHKGSKKVIKNGISMSIPMPVEEQQRLFAGPS